ncbi:MULTISPECIES: glutamate--tRNA ligase family protein [unclassified Flavobacterium]|uniref:glutamate--tRNA ligase family protein n=1 Tax=unclassified Flavobacterium TaxID=196869 RepID=UPI001F12C3E5|nr:MULTISPECIES: glutamate--tRNA ligase family protein [unclassified Flavobacterium]UMY66594.1 glutamate--tRNA ligase family protein [Flavobacterium sp. HJ-32-4]
MQYPSFTKTRLAPTPSGYLHLGNAYSFLLTAALAKRHGAKILLRIDDIDRGRTRDAYVTDIFDSLAFLQVEWDEGPKTATDFHQHFSQYLRMPLYETLLQRLVATGRVYACGCSRKQLAEQGGHDATGCRARQLPLDAPDVAWRINTDDAGPISVRTLDGTNRIGHLEAGTSDFIIRKRDGGPAYQIASLADDLYFGVDLIVRGDDLWTSTLSQLFLARLLGEQGFLDATFHHHGLLTDDANRKLSKSEGATSLRYMKSNGAGRETVLGLIREELPGIPFPF